MSGDILRREGSIFFAAFVRIVDVAFIFASIIRVFEFATGLSSRANSADTACDGGRGQSRYEQAIWKGVWQERGRRPPGQRGNNGNFLVEIEVYHIVELITISVARWVCCIL